MYDGGVYLLRVLSLETVVYVFPGSAGVHTPAVSPHVGRGGRVDTSGSGLVRPEVLSVDCVQRCRHPGPVDTPRPRAVDAACPRAVNAACPGADVQLLSGDVLQLVQTPQLLVEGVHDHQGTDIEHVEDHPREEREEIVTKDHVIDDCGVTKLYNLPDDEECHCN